MNADMHVAITLEQFWHRVPGGTATSVHAMTDALSKRSAVEMTGVSAWHKTRPPARFRVPLPIEWMPLPRPALYEAWHRLRRPRVDLATGAVDVIHATTFAIPPRSAPLVVTVHDLAFLHAPDHFTPRGLRFFRRGMELAQSDADLIVAPSQATATDCAEHGFDPDRIRTVPWGVDITPTSEREVEVIKQELGLDSRYVLWTGTIEPRKNLPRLVDAFFCLDTDAHLVLAGPQGWNEDVQALVGRSPERIRPLGQVEPDVLRALYAGAAAFCYPSLFEGFGLPVLEAMAQGAPVVTSRGISTEEVAGGAAILVDPHEPTSIAEGLQRLLDDPQLAELHSAAGRARAAEMSWDACAERMESIYAEALAVASAAVEAGA